MLLTRQYKEINSETLEGVFDKMIHLVSIVDDLDPLDVQEWRVDKLVNAYSVAQTKVKISDRYSETITIDDVTLKLQPFSKLTLRQFINLEEYVSKGFTPNISQIAATIYLAESGGGIYDLITEDYKNVNVDYRSELIDELPINQIYADVKVEELNEEEKAEYELEMKTRAKQGDNQWMVVLNMLSDFDITKFNDVLDQNLYLAFNQLSYIKSNK
jgi:hypothetical protein